MIGCDVSPKSDFHFQRRRDETLIDQHGRRDLLARGERVIFRHRQPKRLPFDDETGQFGRIALRRARKGDVERAVEQRFELRKGLHALQLKRHVGMQFSETGQGRGNQAAGAGGENVADRDRAGLAAGGAAPDQFGTGRLLERLLRFDQEAFAGMGQGDRALGLAREQLGSEHGFQGADLVAERGGRDIEARGGAAEMQLLGDRDEVPEVAEFHPKIMR